MREFQLGDRVRVGLRVGTIYAMPTRGGGPLADCYRVADHESLRHATWSSYVTADEMSHAEPPAIPRERVEALHAAVTARLEQLAHPSHDDGATEFAHSELSEVAEALRLLLEVDP